jgi:transaldolase
MTPEIKIFADGAVLEDVPKLLAGGTQIFSVVIAADAGCHIITVPNDMLGKLKGLGRDLNDVSLDTVKMFYTDATSSGFRL